MTSVELHAGLVELMTRWRRAVPQGGTIMDLMQWSARQTHDPMDLHYKLDELCAEWAIYQSGIRARNGQLKNPKLFSNTPAAELLEWSARQVREK